MVQVTQFLDENKGWFFPCLAAVAGLVGWIIKYRNDQKRAAGQSIEQNVSVNNAPKTEVIVTNNVNFPEQSQTSNPPISERSGEPDESYKERTTILFIDDDKEFKIVSMLKKAGWKRVSIIEDVDRIDAEKIKAADIIFVDIQGVGKRLGFAREGLGLMKAIKDRYSGKKVVIYSGVPLHDIFAEELESADQRLRKSAEFIEFEKTIEDLL